jgi:autoinducer 2-degrading protein
MFVILAEIHVKPNRVADFAKAIDKHAHNSRSREEGCLGFDVNQDAEDPSKFVLYEVYRDEAAFGVHQTMPSYKWFFDLTTDWIIRQPDDGLAIRRTLTGRAPVNG